MKVIEALTKEKTALSFEFFPPKTAEQETHLAQVLFELKSFDPDFCSVTYGAMGTTREKTFRWVEKIKKEFKIEPVAHLTCVAATQTSIRHQLDELENIGINNILALRGDPPWGGDPFVPPKNGFKFAKDLILFIKDHHPEFCVGAAGFPEKEEERFLQEKIGAGAEYVITQMFFDNSQYFRFLERCGKQGINVPIIPGIMPITNLKQIKKITSMCGAAIPEGLLSLLEEYGDDSDAVLKIGVEHAIGQCKELIDQKVPGLHFFVMNQSGPITKILQKLI